VKLHHGGLVHAGAEVVLVDFDIVPLAGEFEGVVDSFDALACIEAAERGIRIRVGGVDRPRLCLPIIARHNHQPDAAQAVMHVEALVIDRRVCGVVMLPLGQNLRIGVKV